MKAIILAGGSGTRLWPVSRRKNPKQVEAIIGEYSLIQTTYRRLLQGFRPEDIYVATAKEHEAMIVSQLPDLPKDNLIPEPDRRDTAAAIGYALVRIAAAAPDETFITINSDAFVADTDEYHRVLALAGDIVRDHPDNTLLVGITPTYPETGYGYIKTGTMAERRSGGDRTDSVFFVEKFVEKPDLRRAEEYMAHGGYLWNPTLIVGRIGRFLGYYEELLPGHAAAFREIASAIGTAEEDAVISRCFGELEPVSIDYGILEKSEGLLVLPAEFGWADVGNWKTVLDLLAEKKGGNVIKGTHVGVDSSGNLIYSYGNKLVATAGLSGMIVIETEDVLLVCPQERAQDVKKIVGELKAQKDLQKYL